MPKTTKTQSKTNSQTQSSAKSAKTPNSQTKSSAKSAKAPTRAAASRTKPDNSYTNPTKTPHYQPPFTLKELDPQDFEHFVVHHPQKSHFLQSSYWGRFAGAKKHLHPYYLGLFDASGQLVAATLLLQKRLPLGLCYFYAPRGFVLDFHDHDLLAAMTQAVADFCRQRKAIFFKIDPDLVKSRQTPSEDALADTPDYPVLFQELQSLGYRHQGFTQNFETNQPRYTFRIDLTPDWPTLEGSFAKTARRCIKKAEKLGVSVRIGDASDVKTFFNLMDLTEKRKGVVYFGQDYYEAFFDTFSPDHVRLFLGEIDTDKAIDFYETERLSLQQKIRSILPSKSSASKLADLKKRLQSTEANLARYRAAAEQYGPKIVLSAHMIVLYGDKAWYLYGGNHDILQESCTNYLTFATHIKYAKEQGITTYDEFGTVGDLRPGNSRLGLHEFKKKFGGDYLEFFGEFDYVLRPVPYFFFQKLIPTYRKLVKRYLRKHQD